MKKNFLATLLILFACQFLHSAARAQNQLDGVWAMKLGATFLRVNTNNYTNGVYLTMLSQFDLQGGLRYIKEWGETHQLISTLSYTSISFPVIYNTSLNGGSTGQTGIDFEYWHLAFRDTWLGATLAENQQVFMTAYSSGVTVDTVPVTEIDLSFKHMLWLFGPYQILLRLDGQYFFPTEGPRYSIFQGNGYMTKFELTRAVGYESWLAEARFGTTTQNTSLEQQTSTFTGFFFGKQF